MLQLELANKWFSEHILGGEMLIILKVNISNLSTCKEPLIMIYNYKIFYLRSRTQLSIFENVGRKTNPREHYNQVMGGLKA